MGWLRRRSEPDVVIDLRDPVAAPRSVPRWGSPAPCPDCASRGYLDHVDPFAEVMYLHCTRCGMRYEITKAETERRVGA